MTDFLVVEGNCLKTTGVKSATLRDIQEEDCFRVDKKNKADTMQLVLNYVKKILRETVINSERINHSFLRG